jgi:hypothetical protein
VNTIHPAPTNEELGVAVREAYEIALRSGVFAVHYNLFEIHNKVLEHRAKVVPPMPPNTELADRLTVIAEFSRATCSHFATAGPAPYVVYDYHFGGRELGKGNTGPEAWADAARNVRNGLRAQQNAQTVFVTGVTTDKETKDA